MPSILETIHDEMVQWAECVQHGAAWLVGAAAIAQKDIQAAEASSPLVAGAVDVAVSWAKAQGVPVNDIETLSNAVLTLAKTVAPAAAPSQVVVPEHDPA